MTRTGRSRSGYMVLRVSPRTVESIAGHPAQGHRSILGHGPDVIRKPNATSWEWSPGEFTRPHFWTSRLHFPGPRWLGTNALIRCMVGRSRTRKIFRTVSMAWGPPPVQAIPVPKAASKRRKRHPFVGGDTMPHIDFTPLTPLIQLIQELESKRFFPIPRRPSTGTTTSRPVPLTRWSARSRCSIS